MKRMLKLGLFVVPLLAVGWAATAVDAEEAAGADIPDRVRAAFRRAYPTATISGYELEKRGEETLHEIECVDGGAEKAILFRADGYIVEVEEVIATSSLPDTVLAAVAAAYPDGEITAAEKITRGKTIEYEIEVRHGAVTTEVLVSSRGTILGAEDEEDSNDAD